MSTKRTPDTENGFTLIEVLLIAPFMIIMISVIVSLLVNLTTNNLLSGSEIELSSDTKTALNFIEDDVRLSPAFITTSESAFDDPYGPDNAGTAWSYKGANANNRALISRTYATSKSIKDPDKTPVYISKYGCDTAVLPSNPVLTTNTIYFVRNSNLYRRILTDTSQALCNTQFQRQSCPTDVAYPRATICRTDDSLLVKGVTKFDVQYYANSGDTTPIDVYASTDPYVLSSAKTIEVTISAAQTVAGEQLSSTSSIRISRLND